MAPRARRWAAADNLSETVGQVPVSESVLASDTFEYVAQSRDSKNWWGRSASRSPLADDEPGIVVDIDQPVSAIVFEAVGAISAVAG